MKVLFLHKYGPAAASYRYRFEQYFPYLRNNGIDVQAQVLLDEAAVKSRIQLKGSSLFNSGFSYLKRFVEVSRLQYDAIVLHFEAFPYLPYLFEKALVLKNTPFILDMDDAFYLTYEKSSQFLVRRVLEGKYPKLFSSAAKLHLGNQVLAEKAAPYNSNIEIFPTVIDSDYYQPQKRFDLKKTKYVVGWMGSPSTTQYVEKIVPQLEPLLESGRIELRLVGARRLNRHYSNVTYVEWSQTEEIKNLLDFDIGLMPLEDTDWSRGKCGFKLVQYMGVGVPAIASPVGINCQIVEEGKTGFFARRDEDWLQCIERFLNEPHQFASFGEASRKKIEQEYSLQVYAPRMLRALQELHK